MLSIIFPYRNRDLVRVQHSLHSLSRQTSSNFEVFFVDYGSEITIAREVEEICRNYYWLNYVYHPVQYQPWSKAKALNSVIKQLKSEFCFVADIDIIFHPNFVETAQGLGKEDQAVYFQIGYLKKEELIKDRNFEDFKSYKKSNIEATGLSLFPVKALHEIKGFDEFYHFWGAEDTDVHVRLKNAGYQVQYYEKEVLLLHQWHPSYINKETNKLTSELQLTRVVQLNYQHLIYATANKVVCVNSESWGEKKFCEPGFVEESNFDYIFNNERGKIEDFLYGQLPQFKNKNIKIRVTEDAFQKSLKYQIRKILRKKVPEYLSLKEINDIILLHLISFYRNKPYFFKVDENLRGLTFGIQM